MTAAQPARAMKTSPERSVSHAEMANAIRFLAADAVEKANSGHPGMPMGMADVATVLFSRFLKFDAAAPDWHDRDRFVLSAGHGSMLLYALLYLTGYADMTIDEIRNFRQLGSPASRPPPARWGRGWPTPSAWRSRKGCSTSASATNWSTITPTPSPATAA